MSEFDPKIVYLTKKNEYIIGFEDQSTKLVQRTPLSSKIYKEITYLVKQSNIEDPNIFFDNHKKISKYCLNINDDEYDTIIWESNSELEDKYDVYGLRNIIEACLTRCVNGIAYFRQPSKTGQLTRAILKS